MGRYLRLYRPGGTYFFTLVAERRMRMFGDAENVQRFRDGITRCKASLPFELVAGVVLPDHAHLILTLPEDDADFSTRLRFIKSNFSAHYLAAGGVEQARSGRKSRTGERGVWQSRFWEHLCRNEDDLARHVDYIHFNPVKHGLVRCPHDWPASSFQRWIERGWSKRDWCCACDDSSKGGSKTRPTPLTPDFSWACDEME